MLERREPLTVVDLNGPILLDVSLIAHDLALKAHILECTMCADERQGSRRFIALTRFHADHTVLDHVDTAETVRTSDLVHSFDDLKKRHLLAIERHRNASSERDLDLGRLIGSSLRIDRHRIDVGRRRCPRIFEHAALDRATPQVVVDRIGVGLGSIYGHAVSFSVIDLFRTRMKIPFAHGGQDLDAGVERLDGSLEADLIVALAGATMGDVLRTFFMRDINQELGDEWTRKRRDQRVLAFEVRICSKRLGKVFVHEKLAHIDDVAFERTGLQCLFLHLLKALMLLTDLTHNRDDIEAFFFLEPLDAHRGIKTAGICEYYLIFCHVVSFLNRRKFHLCIVACERALRKWAQHAFNSYFVPSDALPSAASSEELFFCAASFLSASPSLSSALPTLSLSISMTSLKLALTFSASFIRRSYSS